MEQHLSTLVPSLTQASNVLQSGSLGKPLGGPGAACLGMETSAATCATGRIGGRPTPGPKAAFGSTGGIIDFSGCSLSTGFGVGASLGLGIVMFGLSLAIVMFGSLNGDIPVLFIDLNPEPAKVALLPVGTGVAAVGITASGTGIASVVGASSASTAATTAARKAHRQKVMARSLTDLRAQAAASCVGRQGCQGTNQTILHGT
mmetsp:Transcript_106722/g.271029  ORF Transcript_106722/g.271029 Transcript_106722/m.271029 type:complete len:203 (-) Transcript_106722:2-610(-)